MFKTITVFKVDALWNLFNTVEFETQMEQLAFVPCTPSQESSVGWVPPRAAEGAFCEITAGEVILKVMMERKTVPAAVIKKELDRVCLELEKTRGFKPGQKEKRDLKEEVKQSLMARAFSKTSACLIWIDRENGTIVVGSTSAATVDTVIDLLLTTFIATNFHPTLSSVRTTESAGSAMSRWLVAKEAPPGFSVDRDCELKDLDEKKTGVRYSFHALDIDEIAEHINHGKRPTKLAMTWEGRVSFELADDMSVRKLDFLEDVFDDDDDDDDGVDAFDADVVISTSSLKRFIPDLIGALGGEVVVNNQDEDGIAAEEADSEDF